jgi:hypothetical protein
MYITAWVHAEGTSVTLYQVSTFQACRAYFIVCSIVLFGFSAIPANFVVQLNFVFSAKTGFKTTFKFLIDIFRQTKLLIPKTPHPRSSHHRAYNEVFELGLRKEIFFAFKRSARSSCRPTKNWQLATQLVWRTYAPTCHLSPHASFFFRTA